MNTGIIASRYAKALLRYVIGHGDAERVCAQAAVLERALGEVPALQKIVADPAGVPTQEKMDLLRAALDGQAMAPALERFLVLVQDGGRLGDLRLILHDFSALYRRSKGIHLAEIVTAVPLSDEMRETIRQAICRHTGGQVELQEQVDPSLIAGLVVTVDGYRADTSVRAQLQALRTHFIKQNKRIV